MVRSSSRYRGRFAPSPTGQLHFGSLVAALGSWLFARAAQGTWIVRIEDLDPPREVAGADRAILDALERFGLVADEPVVYQSRRSEAYEQTLRELEAAGRAYPCWCSRTDLAPYAGIHPRHCVAAADPARTPAIRVRVPERTISFGDRIQGTLSQDLARDVGDFVVRRADGWYAYQLAVVVDDAAQGITEVVRGADLVESTPRQILLQEWLGFPRVRYAHLPLVLDARGRKLSKQEAALAVDPRDPLPALRAALAFLGQRVPPARRVDDLLALAVSSFDIDAIPSAPRKAPSFAAMRQELS